MWSHRSCKTCNFCPLGGAITGAHTELHSSHGDKAKPYRLYVRTVTVVLPSNVPTWKVRPLKTKHPNYAISFNTLFADNLLPEYSLKENINSSVHICDYAMIEKGNEKDISLNAAQIM